MTTLLENPLPAFFIGGFLVIVLLAIALKTGRGIWLIVMGGALLITAGLIVLEQWVVTERERVEQTIDGAAAAVEANNVAAVLEYVSPSAAETRARIRAQLPAYTISNVSLSDVTVEVFGNPAANATADVIGRCWVDERCGGARLSYVGRYFVRLQKENGRWLLTSYEERPVFGN